MKTMFAAGLAALIALPAHAQVTPEATSPGAPSSGAPSATAAIAAEPSAGIVRAGPAASPILASVTVPAGMTTYYLSGMLADPLDPAKPGATVEAYGDTKTQTVSIFTKMKAMLEGMGLSMSDVVKLTVFVGADPKSPEGEMDFVGFNDGYKQFFGTAEQPNKVARSTVQVAALAAPWALIEIEAIAVK